MSFWDTFCVHCGVAPSGGPRWFSTSYQLEDEAKKIADIHLESGNCQKDMQQIVLNALKASQEQDFPDGLGYKDYSDTFVSMGYWGDEGQDEWVRDPEAWRIPCGHKVQVRRIRNVTDGYGGKFNTLVKQAKTGRRSR